MERPKLWTKDFLIDTMINFFIYSVYYFLLVIMAVYAMNHLHATTSEAGLASGIFVVGALIARVLSGRFIEQVGRKKLLYIGLVFFLITTLLYFAATNLAILDVIRFLHGIGFGMASTAASTIVANIVPEERRGEGISYYALSVTLASAIGPSIAMYLNQHGNFNAIVTICAVIIVLSMIATFFLKVPETKLTEEQMADLKQVSLSGFFEVKAIPIAVISALMGISFSSIVSFLAAYTQQVNLMMAGNVFFLVYAAFILVSRPMTGRLFDQKGENFVMYPCYILFAAGLVIIGLSHMNFVLLLASVFVGLGFGTFMSSAQTIAVKVSPPHRMGLATSTFFGFMDGGMGVGPLLLGFLIPVIDYRGLYISMAVLVIVCLFLYYFLHGKHADHAETVIMEG